MAARQNQSVQLPLVVVLNHLYDADVARMVPPQLLKAGGDIARRQLLVHVGVKDPKDGKQTSERLLWAIPAFFASANQSVSVTFVNRICGRLHCSVLYSAAGLGTEGMLPNLKTALERLDQAKSAQLGYNVAKLLNQLYATIGFLKLENEVTAE